MRDPWGPPPARSPSPSRGWILWFALLAAVVALVAFLVWRYSDSLTTGDDWASVVYLVALLALVSSSILVGRRLPLGHVARQAAAWIGIALVLVAGYTYRLELGAVGERMLGELLPHRAVETAEREIRIRVGADGHFRLEAMVDGRPVRFLVDTGATSVVLSPNDATRLGYDLAKLSFTGFARTANGTVRTAPIRLGNLVVGNIRLTDLPAVVNQAAMGSSLLGMSFLDRLRSYEVRDGALVMRW